MSSSAASNTGVSGSSGRATSGTKSGSSSAAPPPRSSNKTPSSSIPGGFTGNSSPPDPDEYVEADSAELGLIIQGYLEMAIKRPANGFATTPELMSSELLQSVFTRPNDTTIPHPKDFSDDRFYIPHKLFWAEWKCFMGPHVEESQPPPLPFVPDEEHGRFITLFPYGTGGWPGPTGHRTPTFEEYAQSRLQLADPRFRHSKEWLEWVLTRTQDKELAGSVNEALILFFDVKARHLGKGRIERKPVDVYFKRLTLRGGVLV